MNPFIIIPAVLVLAPPLMAIPGMSRSRRKRTEVFEKRPVAHRGLFDNSSSAPENTLPAFERAASADYAIELDIRLTRDGIPVVFHDADLRRAAGIKKSVSSLTYSELCNISLFGSAEHIPLLSEALGVIGGRVPVIAEIKAEDRGGATASAADYILRSYSGEYCIESFRPDVLLWYRLHRPDVLRGQLSMNYLTEKRRKRYGSVLSLALTGLLFNFITKPDFIAYELCGARSLPLRFMRLFGAKTAAWTVRSEEDMKTAKKHFDIVIFDSFIPKEEEL